MHLGELRMSFEISRNYVSSTRPPPPEGYEGRMHFSHIHTTYNAYNSSSTMHRVRTNENHEAHTPCSWTITVRNLFLAHRYEDDAVMMMIELARSCPE